MKNMKDESTRRRAEDSDSDAERLSLSLRSGEATGDLGVNYATNGTPTKLNR